MPAWKPPTPGALDDTKWPENLVARAVAPGDGDDRIHGYAVVGDIARHYRYSDLIFLSITGELPDERASMLCHLALHGFASLTVNEAPAHVAVLSRICGGTFGSAYAAGVIALVDQVRQRVARQAALLAWCAAPTGELPSEACELLDAAWLTTLGDTLAALGMTADRVRTGMSRDAACIALLYEAGLHQPEHLEAAIVAARTNGLVAEILATGPVHLGSYPVKLPPFHYLDEGSR